MTLASVLQLEPVGEDRWRAQTPPGSGRTDIFGGQVAAQALRAAGFTVPSGHLPNSIHGYFLRRGQAALPIDVFVERLRGGRTYTSRRVDVSQEGKTIFAMLASFHADEPSREFDHPMPAGVPQPESIPPTPARFGWKPLVEARSVETEPPILRWWGRVAPAGIDDPALDFCSLLYASDMWAGGAALAAVGYGTGFIPARDGEERPTGNFGSLDHALWFHRAPRIDDWFLCEVRPLTVRDSRGLVFGTMFARDGQHLASFTQEMFIKDDAFGSAGPH